jgi:cytochrome c oxidase subunit II
VPARRRTLTRLVGLITVALLATGCNSGQWSRGGWPSPVTQQGKQVLGLWRGSLITALVVGAFVIALIIWSAIWFRRRGDELPRQVRYNLPIEVLYTLIPVVMVAILFYFTAIRENDEVGFNQTPKLRVGIVGFQWSWQFNYLDDGVSITGRPGQPPQLVLPTNVPIRFYETSPDVIHAWWVIPFLFKRDVIPGRVNSFELTVTKEGVFNGKCTEYCGVDHDRMLFTVKAVSWTDYLAWLAQEKTVAASGSDQMVSVYTGPATPTNAKPGTTQGSAQ